MNSTTGPVFKVVKKHHVQLYVKPNTTKTASNGEAEVWVDGVRVIQRTGVCFMGIDYSRVDHCYFSSFYGGNDPSWAPSKTTQITFGNAQVYAGKPRAIVQ